MTDPVNPNTSPKVNVSVPPEPQTPSVPQGQVNLTQEQAPKTRPAADVVRRAGEGSQEHQRSSNLIQNPKREERHVEKPPTELPQSTIDEMAAGQAALKRNAPTAIALDEARAKLEADKKKA